MTKRELINILENLQFLEDDVEVKTKGTLDIFFSIKKVSYEMDATGFGVIVIE